MVFSLARKCDYREEGKKLFVRTSFAQCSLLDSLDTTNQTSACEYFFNGWNRATRVTFQLENIFAALSCTKPCYYRMLSLRNVRIESDAVGNSRCFHFYPYERNSFDWLVCKTAITALDVFRGFQVKMEKSLSSSQQKCLEFPVQSLLIAPSQLFAAVQNEKLVHFSFQNRRRLQQPFHFKASSNCEHDHYRYMRAIKCVMRGRSVRQQCKYSMRIYSLKKETLQPTMSKQSM